MNFIKQIYFICIEVRFANLNIIQMTFFDDDISLERCQYALVVSCEKLFNDWEYLTLEVL